MQRPDLSYLFNDVRRSKKDPSLFTEIKSCMDNFLDLRSDDLSKIINEYAIRKIRKIEFSEEFRYVPYITKKSNVFYLKRTNLLVFLTNKNEVFVFKSIGDRILFLFKFKIEWYLIYNLFVHNDQLYFLIKSGYEAAVINLFEFFDPSIIALISINNIKEIESSETYLSLKNHMYNDLVLDIYNPEKEVVSNYEKSPYYLTTYSNHLRMLIYVDHFNIDSGRYHLHINKKKMCNKLLLGSSTIFSEDKIYEISTSKVDDNYDHLKISMGNIDDFINDKGNMKLIYDKKIQTFTTKSHIIAIAYKSYIIFQYEIGSFSSYILIFDACRGEFITPCCHLEGYRVLFTRSNIYYFKSAHFFKFSIEEGIKDLLNLHKNNKDSIFECYEFDRMELHVVPLILEANGTIFNFTFKSSIFKYGSYKSFLLE